jgi:hypothetical protein
VQKIVQRALLIKLRSLTSGLIVLVQSLPLVIGGAADVVLTALLGKDVSFTTAADPSLNLAPRSFNSFTQAAEEAGMSRVYGGSHWLSDNRDGLIAGRNLGNYVVQNFMGSP